MLNDPIIAALEKAASGASLKHEAILNNISNVNTPGYKRSDVEFKSELSRVMGKTGNLDKNQLLEKIRSADPDIIKETNTSLRPDGNNVDIDKEMSYLAENALEYNTYLSLLSKRFKILKTVISEGRR